MISAPASDPIECVRLAKKFGACIATGVFSQVVLFAIEKDLTAKDVALFRSHPKIQALAHALCGPDLGVTDEDTVNIGLTRASYRDWHRDFSERSALGGIVPVWRFGVYFRDYSQHSDGLQIIACSHLDPLRPVETYRGRVVVESRPGDVVIWNLRTLHAAGADNQGKPIASPRNAVFFDFGTPSNDLDRYNALRAEKKAREPHKHQGGKAA